MGTAYGLKGLTDKAQSEFKKAIDINLNEAVAKIVFNVLPANKHSKAEIDEVKARINLGNAYKQEEKLERAKLEYEKVLELKPEHSIAKRSLSEIYYELGTSYLEEEKYNNAITVFGKALEIKPDFTQIKDVLEKAHYSLGISYAKNKELDKAILEFNRAIEINPDYAKLDRNILNLIDKGVDDGAGDDVRKEGSREDEKGDKRHKEQTEMPSRNELMDEVIVAVNEGNVKNPRFTRYQDEISFNAEKIGESDESRQEEMHLETELESKGQDVIQIQGDAVVEEKDEEKVSILDTSYEKEISNKTDSSDKVVSVQPNHSDQKAGPSSSGGIINDDQEEQAVVEGETVSVPGHRTVSYYITRNYSPNIGYNEAIEKYEDVIRKNPYDNYAFHNLAYAYYNKALHLDDAIAMREDARESNQNFFSKTILSQ
ncbi:MAG: hypothetical protein SCARUB_05208 [Candidatus Scalindua rubra]|uniref:Tetratricopeptide repeat protein n=1 Tax=Candidatus Scalindua rubra TaxID=1872076 RepID=A0A1E3X233_9BACT|nr:MAG: hypothetical protein SCARUB_05208 [Candidatus Scalindua rubra]